MVECHEKHSNWLHPYLDFINTESVFLLDSLSQHALLPVHEIKIYYLLITLMLWKGLWKDPAAGKDWGQEEKGWQRMRWLDGLTDSMDVGLGRLGRSWWTGRPSVLQFMGSQRVGHDWATELNWITLRLVKNPVTIYPLFALQKWKLKKFSRINL